MALRTVHDFGEVVDHVDLHPRPIIQSSPLEPTTVRTKAERSNEDEMRACHGARAHDIAAILRDLRLIKHYVHLGRGS